MLPLAMGLMAMGKMVKGSHEQQGKFGPNAQNGAGEQAPDEDEEKNNLIAKFKQYMANRGAGGGGAVGTAGAGGFF